MTALPVAANRYFDTKFQRPGVKLLPNEFFVTSDDIVLSTVLGSCVAACVFDPVAGIGGMNHFMLPDDGAQAFGAACASMRYGAYAMEILLNELLKGGARRERLEAKVFGGGAVLAGMTTLNIGDRNAEFVRRYLALEQVRIVAEDLQGKHPRKVVYLPRTGQALVKKMPVIQDSPLERREQALALALSQERLRPAGAIELFAAQPRRARATASGAQDAVPGPGRPGSVS